MPNRASAALWADESHVEANRAAYRAKLDLAEKHLSGRFGFYRPAGGFLLWLDVGDGEDAARTLWRDAAVRTLPGAYISRANARGENPGQRYLRVALVADNASSEAGLTRIVAATRQRVRLDPSDLPFAIWRLDNPGGRRYGRAP